MFSVLYSTKCNWYGTNILFLFFTNDINYFGIRKKVKLIITNILKYKGVLCAPLHTVNDFRKNTFLILSNL